MLVLCTAGCDFAYHARERQGEYLRRHTGASRRTQSGGISKPRRIHDDTRRYWPVQRDGARGPGGDCPHLEWDSTANDEFSVFDTPQTVFSIGSNTKQLTPAAIMKLQEQGRLNVTDPVTRFIPNATTWKDIRIYHLLNHTSGIQSDGALLITDPVDLTLPENVERTVALPLTFGSGEEAGLLGSSRRRSRGPPVRQEHRQRGPQVRTLRGGLPARDRRQRRRC
ncbi:Beta-lactamase [anaerobic digester metagenome]